MDKLFQIGAFCFRLVCPEDITIPGNFQKFEAGCGGRQPQYTYRLQIVRTLPPAEGTLLAGRQDLAVYQNPAGEERFLGVKGRTGPYAEYRELSEAEAEIFFLEDDRESLRTDTVFTSLFSLERRMIRHESLILHCAYIKYRGKAILFSAPSGTGKSTQAGLWEKYRGSVTMNGDRALLRKKDGIWHACGWPVCGSSGICHPEDTPAGAIVMLRQGIENHAEQLSPVQAFTQLYGQVTVNQWNHSFVSKAAGLLGELAQSVPVFLLACDMTEGAVQCLERALFQDHVESKGYRNMTEL